MSAATAPDPRERKEFVLSRECRKKEKGAISYVFLLPNVKRPIPALYYEKD